MNNRINGYMGSGTKVVESRSGSDGELAGPVITCCGLFELRISGGDGWTRYHVAYPEHYLSFTCRFV